MIQLQLLAENLMLYLINKKARYGFSLQDVIAHLDEHDKRCVDAILPVGVYEFLNVLVENDSLKKVDNLYYENES